MKLYGIIYKITNNVNGKCYIGQTIKTIEQRIYRHKYKSDPNKMPISAAIKKYGFENFTVEVLLSCCCDQQELNDQELRLVNELNTWSPCGYNLRAGDGKGSMSEETKKKIGDKHRGKKASPETIKKLSDSHKGYKVKQETKDKLSLIFKGKKPHINTQIGSSLKNAKHYKLIDPDGNIIEIFNMKKYCKLHNLHASNMCELVRGKVSQYKGYKNIQANE